MSITAFDPHDQYSDLGDVVSSHSVPMVRAWALALAYADSKGAKTSVASGIRTDAIIAEHNKLFGTNLHGQQYLYDNQNRPGFNPANPPSLTSHCWFSDGNPVYRDAHGNHISAGGQLPRYMHGLDVDDLGKFEDNSHLLSVLASGGFHAVRPYSAGSEQHHLVLATDPLHALVDLGVHVRTLKPGVTPGKDVLHASRMLKHLGYFSKTHEPSPKYGQQVQKAVQDFKGDHKIDPDPILGVTAWKALERANAHIMKGIREKK